jgi:hypothetical protein
MKGIEKLPVLFGFLMAGVLSALAVSACQRLPVTAPTIPAPPSSIPTVAPTQLEQGRISGSVLDQAGKPVAGATVRIQASQDFTTSDGQGRFVLRGLETGKAVTVSAWTDLYYCGRSINAAPIPEERQSGLRLGTSDG